MQNLFVKKIKSLNGPKKLVFVSLKQFSFLAGPTKLVFVRIYVSTFTGLVGPLSLRQFIFKPIPIN